MPTSNARNSAMLKEAATFADHLKHCEKDIRTLKNSSEGDATAFPAYSFLIHFQYHARNIPGAHRKELLHLHHLGLAADCFDGAKRRSPASALRLCIPFT